MMEWLDNIAGPGYSAAILWTFAALILLVIVLLIIKLVRSMTFGTFVAGGRNRKTRLAVMDATAVDSHRRLILVRRDDIEHLLLIGGPTDVVVERDIRLTQQRRPALTGDGGQEAPARPRSLEQQIPARPAPQPRPPEPAQAPQPTQIARAQALASAVRPAPAPAPRPAPAPTPAPVVARVEPPRVPLSSPAPRHEPPVQTASRYQAPAVAPSQPAVQSDELDESLLKELEFSLDDAPKPASPKAPEVSLDDEMTKLLGELSSHKR